MLQQNTHRGPVVPMCIIDVHIHKYIYTQYICRISHNSLHILFLRLSRPSSLMHRHKTFLRDFGTYLWTLPIPRMDKSQHLENMESACLMRVSKKISWGFWVEHWLETLSALKRYLGVSLTMGKIEIWLSPFSVHRSPLITWVEFHGSPS